MKEAESIFRVALAFSKSPHLHRAYLVTVCKWMSMTVNVYDISYYFRQLLLTTTKCPAVYEILGSSLASSPHTGLSQSKPFKSMIWLAEAIKDLYYFDK